MSGASANSCVIRSPRLCGFHQRDEGDQRSNLSPCLLSASDPEFAYARGFYVWSPDSGVLPLLFTPLPSSILIRTVARLIHYVVYTMREMSSPVLAAWGIRSQISSFSANGCPMQPAQGLIGHLYPWGWPPPSRSSLSFYLPVCHSPEFSPISGRD